MTQSPSSLRPASALQEPPAPPASRLASCPFCHTRHGSLTQEAALAECDWLCVRCGQRWDASRLRTVAAYAAWVAAQPGSEG
jgi:hypothetical protein